MQKTFFTISSSGIYFFCYLVILVFISASKSIEILLINLFFLILLANAGALRIMLKSLALVVFFSLSITSTYSLVLYIQGQPFWNYFLSVNLRSFDMIFLTLLFVSRVNVFEAFSFSKELSFLIILSVSKILTMQRAFADYTDALKSRTIKKPSRGEIYDYLGSAIAGFLDKNIRESKENFEAMRSRGFSV